MNLTQAQAAMRQEQIDCWLVYDFQQTNPIMGQLLPTDRFISRRLFLLIPASREPVLLGSRIDNDILRSLPYQTIFYVSWQEMEQKLAELLADYQVIGLDYSPAGALPTASRIDAGTFEMIQKLGKTIKPAANVFQAAVAVWSDEALAAHQEDCQRVAQIKDEAFQLIADRLGGRPALTEYQVQQFIMQRFKAENLFPHHPPIVAVNHHSGDPHYSPSPEQDAPIEPGDWILIDLWAKRPGPDYIFADMTWVGVAAASPTERQQAVFEVVKAGRDKALTYLTRQNQQGVAVEGWQVDDVVRQEIGQAGYGDHFFHRTGHSLGPGDIVHGQGVNLDNLESHDTRRLQPGLGFTIEPGIYLPEFGVRLEINVYMAETGPQVTTPIQRKIICLA